LGGASQANRFVGQALPRQRKRSCFSKKANEEPDDDFHSTTIHAGDCTRLGIAWDQHDHFTDHAANLWNDLVLDVIQASQFCPELADPQLPSTVRDRLNDHLKRRGAQLLAGQRGLVVDIARGAKDYFHPPADIGPAEPMEPLLASPSLSQSMDLFTVSTPPLPGMDAGLAAAIIPADTPGIERRPFWQSPILAGAESDEVVLRDVLVSARTGGVHPVAGSVLPSCRRAYAVLAPSRAARGRTDSTSQQIAAALP
jgi:hypothetical protein